MPSSIRRVFFENYVFQVYRNVYEPAEDSFLFAESLAVKKGEVILDMGTGCGILSIIAADKAAKVVAVDVSPHAVRCAKENAKLNSVADKMFFVNGDLFASVKIGEKFSSIFFNAPYLPSEPTEDAWLELAWTGGVTGREVIDRFISEAPKFLRRDGCIFLMQSTLSNVDETLRRFEKRDLKTSIVAKRALPFFEVIVLVEAKH
ncbi:methyltransferase [Candidatus Bathyarchaeota archaeon]|nr:methyltransferase [Candidatus Bathyarchaeota archaeon]